MVAGLWNLPPECRTVLANHHSVMVDGMPHPYTSVLVMAEHFGAQRRTPYAFEKAPPPQRIIEAGRALRLDDARIALIGKEVDKVRGELTKARSDPA